MSYKIGIDLGISSVGWATMKLNENDEPCRILDMGSRVFDVAENPKNGASLALPRREARGARRRLRRHRHRILRIKQLIDRNIMPMEEIDAIFSSGKQLSDIYEIRCNSLDCALDKEDFVRLLIHLAQRRGFKSNRKVDSNDKNTENGKLLSAVQENNRLKEEKGYRTVGEMLYKDEKFKNVKRNKNENYAHTFSRDLLAEEIYLIFESQSKLGNPYATNAIRDKYLEIYLSQRSFDDGPGGNSKYGGNQIEKMCGDCTFEKGEKRAFKAEFSAEYCNLLQKVNSIKIGSSYRKEPLTQEQRSLVLEFCFAHETVKYSQLRRLLKLNDEQLFNISYGNKLAYEVEEKTKLNYLTCYHKIKKAFKEDFSKLSKEKLNCIGYCLSAYKNDKKIVEELKAHNFTLEEIEIVLTLPSFSKTGNLSIKACDKLIPYLKQGMLYNEACQAAGYDFKADNTDEKSFLLPTSKEATPELGEITNPVVHRAISQAIKVINSIIRNYGESPTFVSIELARELSKNKFDRDKIKKSQLENASLNERIKNKIEKEFGHINPTGLDIVKLKLWEQQDGICPYSLEPIDITRLFEVGYVDIDHIIPYSISFDDSYNNKVLVLSKENRQKGNRLPLEYIKDKDAFIVWVNNTIKNYKKRNNLLKEKIELDDYDDFRERNLTDTRYISRFMYNFIRNHLKFAPNNTGKKKLITSVNGACTAYVRKRWGINKIREDGDVHHAVDAVVISCITDGMIKKISDYSRRREEEYVVGDETMIINSYTGEVKELHAPNKFPEPYPNFRKELEIRTSNDPMRYLNANLMLTYDTNEQINPIFVSRMPNRKVTGPAHKETVKSGKIYKEEGQLIKKVSIKSLKLNKNGEISDYYNPGSDVLLYEALKERLIAFNGNGEKAFAEDFYKPKSDGSQGPLVKNVKIVESSSLNVSVQNHNGVADNGSMVRVDVFIRDGKYYLVPIYVSDTVKDTLPNKAIVQGKSYNDWIEMKDEEFAFSLYSRDLIKVTSKRDIKFSLSNKESTLPKEFLSKDTYLYYLGTSISTASINVINHDNTYKKDSLGVKTLLSLEKYQVDILGNITKVNREKRMGFN